MLGREGSNEVWVRPRWLAPSKQQSLWLLTSWSEQSSPGSAFPDVIESLVGLRERLAHADRKAETLVLDELSEIRERCRIWPKKGPCVISSALRQGGAVALLFRERLQSTAHPAVPVQITQHWMHRGRMAQSTLPQAAHERKVIVPCSEVERRIERAVKRGKRLFIAIKNFGGARVQTSSQRFRPRDGGDVGIPG